MARPLLFVRPNSMLEVTVRTLDGRQLLRPVPQVREAIYGIIGRALQLYPVLLHAFVFLSNHGHLALTTPDADALLAFRAHVFGNIARVVKAMTGWSRPVWAKPTPPAAILDDVASVRRLM